MSASRSGRRFALATAVAGLLATPLAVVTTVTPAHAAPAAVEVQILGTNDFHGRLLPNTDYGAAEAGAAQFAAAVTQLSTAHPSTTIFAAAGDLIGASTFESFIQRDRPTIAALNAAGLDVSAAGNHEFDAGSADLVSRVMAPYDATTNPDGGAEWQYLAANVRKKSDSSYALPDSAASPGTSDGGTWTSTVDGVKVGFIGAVTEDLPSLVTPSSIADVKISGIIAETNAAADALKAGGADVVILLVHEGAPSTALADASTNDNAFSRIVKGVDQDVNAIISGHTHLAYNHSIAGRPVVSAGQYGTNLNKLVFSVDTTTRAVTVAEQSIVQANKVNLTDPGAVAKKAEVQAIVDAAVAKADVLGAKEIGSIAGPFNRAQLASGSENRGGESTLSNLVAEVHRSATSGPEAGGAQIAFMNPGGLRADLTGVDGGFPTKVTYKQAAVIQPFANTLVNMKMTGSQIKTVLEQQWQRDSKGAVPTRPFLRLGTSEGFFSTYDTTRPEGARITGMWLNGKAVEPGASYSVTANSFLASGGDNFRGFVGSGNPRDTGKSDLQAMVDYLAAKASSKALPVDGQQRQVGITWPADAPRFYRIGSTVRLSLSSLAMTSPTDARDAKFTIKAGDVKLFRAKVDNTVDAAPFDESGRSDVAVRLKGATATRGQQMLTFTGATTGTTFSVPIDVRKALAVVNGRVKPRRIVSGKTRTRVRVKTTALGIKAVSGKVLVKAGGKKYTVKLRKGKASIRLARFNKAGQKRIVVIYQGTPQIRGKRMVFKIRVHRN